MTNQTSPPDRRLSPRFLGSAFSAGLAAVPILIGVMLTGMAVTSYGPSPQEREAALCRKIAHWQSKHGADPELHVARVDVSFDGRYGNFMEGEGAVVAHVGSDLAGVQEVVETAAVPDEIAHLVREDVHSLAWPYTGRVHRDMKFTGLALIRRKASPPANPDRDLTIADTLIAADGLLNAGDLGGHKMGKCAVFEKWVRSTAGDISEPHEAVAALARAVRPTLKEEGTEDACQAVREGKFSPHLSQVVLVMAARQLGISAFAFSGTDPSRRHLVGVRTEPMQWRFLDIQAPGDGYLQTAPLLVTRAPTLGQIPLSRHDFWDPAAGAYGSMGMTLARTRWSEEDERDERTRITSAPLSEGCR